MAKFTVGRPSQQVRLRNWPAGRVAEMRLMVSRLEEGLNDSLASRVQQSDKRAFNTNVPIIIEFEVNPGFRQFQITFPPPPGLGGAGIGSVAHPDRQLLYYEIEHSAYASMILPETTRTPQNNIIIGGVGLAETRYFRARVVNTKFGTSPWTSVTSATSAAGSMLVTNILDKTTRLDTGYDTWRDVASKTYTALEAGAVCVTAHISVGACQTDATQPAAPSGLGIYRSGPGMVQFRWVIDVDDTTGFHPWGDRMLLSARPGYTGIKIGMGALAYGGLISPWSRPGNETIKIKLQAKKLPGSKWKGGEGDGTMTEADPMIFFRNGRVIEVLESF